MKTVGLPISKKENEKRRAFTPEQLDIFPYKDHIFVEAGYGDVFHTSDEELKNKGIHVVSRDIALQQDIICDPKIGDESYIDTLKKGQIVFGWVHAVQHRELTALLCKRELTVIAWEDMSENGRHVFWKNNEIAGEAAVMHAFCYNGRFPSETNAAIIGNGNTARGAFRALTALGANVTVYNSKAESIFRKELFDYDIIVNAVLWDLSRNDHLVYESDLIKMKKNSMIIDISCDEGKGIETSKATTIEEPVYEVNGIIHYVVDHTPALFYQTASKSIGKELLKFFPDLMNDALDTNVVLKNATIIKSGVILDHKIKEYQGV
ncbi:MAG: N(5)-(carboxyethyl)ornithine synthase [Clostridium sp.]|jgi:N5-(carboxyethyl)ornithine synthase|nr:N(5)-(carboxyethyl)ornithine synthase [Clostridium sp.]